MGLALYCVHLVAFGVFSPFKTKNPNNACLEAKNGAVFQLQLTRALGSFFNGHIIGLNILITDFEWYTTLCHLSDSVFDLAVPLPFLLDRVPPLFFAELLV